MKEKRMQTALDRIAQRGIPENTNLWPGIAVRLERKSPMSVLRTRPIRALLLVLLMLLLLTGVAYAIGRSLGYIPGIGLVDAGAPIRVLTEPVVQTRDDITVTVSEAVLTSSRTVIVFTVENIPQEKLSRDVAVPGCGMNAGDQVRLISADGTEVRSLGGESGGWGAGYRSTYSFAPLSAEVDAATLVIPCLEGSLPGTLPEQWEIALRFMPAPPELTVIPVTEVTPVQAAPGSGPLVIERTVETDKGYLLVGSFNSNGLPAGAQAMDFSTFPTMTDANGREVLYDFASQQLDGQTVSPAPGSFPWAFEVLGKQQAWPLTITVSAVAAVYPQEQARFVFDAGASPQEGQAWELDQELRLAGATVRVIKAYRTADGYGFDFASDTFFHGVSLWIGNSMPGPTGMQDPQHFSAFVRFEGEIPSGKLDVQVTNPVLSISGTWQTQWQPDVSALDATPTPTTPTQTCLTADSWQAALANPQPIPAELSTIRVLAYGPLSDDYLNYDNYGIFFTRLDGTNKQTVNQYVYPALSPDFHYLVFGAENGLNLIDLTNGIQTLIPNTNSSDTFPVWSPDGKRLAFSRGDELNLYVIDLDGNHLRRVTTENGDEQLVAWTADGGGLYYGVRGASGLTLHIVAVESGVATDLFSVANVRAYNDFNLSPDGARFAFHTRENFSNAIYTSNVDGSDRRLIAQMGNWVVTSPFWLPGGEWLVIVIKPTDLPDQPSELALVNVQDCRVIPLAWRAEMLSGWIP